MRCDRAGTDPTRTRPLMRSWGRDSPHHSPLIHKHNVNPTEDLWLWHQGHWSRGVWRQESAGAYMRAREREASEGRVRPPGRSSVKPSGRSLVLSGRSLETRVALIWAGVRCAATGRRRLRVAVSVCATRPPALARTPCMYGVVRVGGPAPRAACGCAGLA